MEFLLGEGVALNTRSRQSRSVQRVVFDIQQRSVCKRIAHFVHDWSEEKVIGRYGIVMQIQQSVSGI